MSHSKSISLSVETMTSNKAQDWCTCQNKVTRFLIAIYTIH